MLEIGKRLPYDNLSFVASMLKQQLLLSLKEVSLNRVEAITWNAKLGELGC